MPLAHEENTTFRVETPTGDRFVLRIHRTAGSPFHPPSSADEVRSEDDLIRPPYGGDKTGLAVPEPRALAPESFPALTQIVEVEGEPSHGGLAALPLGTAGGS